MVKRQERASLNASGGLWSVDSKKEDIKSVARASSSKAIATPTHSQSQSHRRALSARPASVWSNYSEAFQSSNRHRLLNRLASGFSTTEKRVKADDVQPRPGFTQLTVDVAQARMDTSGFALFAIDLNCSIDTTG